MTLLTNETAVVLWQDVIKHAEDRCSISLEKELESYLISLLIRYTNRPDIVKQLFATAFLEAMQLKEHQRNSSLQHVGDQCLLFAGLFPQVAEKRNVKISYFVDLGRGAYAAISHSKDLYWELALQFVALMDVLQSIRQFPDLLPLQAYEQWQALDSKHAQAVLRKYTNLHVYPIKQTKNK